MLPSTSFFKRTVNVLPKKPQVDSSFIDVGGEPFNALAVAFIDNLKRGVRLSDVSLKKILDRLFTYFPDYKINQAYLTPVERMRLLVNSPRKSEMVDCMAYVLRQLTVDTLLAKPSSYPEAFYGLSAELPKDYLRHQDTSLPSSALAALAEALNIHLILSFKEVGKELRMRQAFSSSGAVDTPYFEVVLQVQGSTYFPRVTNKADFAYIGQLAIKAPKPIVPACEESMAEVLELITTENDAVWRNYQEYRKILVNMVADNELTKDDLIGLYAKFLPKASNVQRFTYIEQQHKKAIVGESSLENFDQNTISRLVDSLARELALGHIADSFFEHIEGPITRTNPAA